MARALHTARNSIVIEVIVVNDNGINDGEF